MSHQDSDPEISIIVPLKDEAENIAPLVAEIVRAMDDGVDGDVTATRWELLLIDDGSTDGSWGEVLAASELEPRCRGIRLRRNVGKSGALAAGLGEACGSIIVTLDGDLQDDPAEIPRLLERLHAGADLVAGNKADRRDPLGKRLPSRLFNKVTSAVVGLKLNDHNCGLKVGRREVFERAPLYGEMHRYLAAFSHAQGFKVVEEDVNHRPRLNGRSKFGLERYTRGALDLLTTVTLTRYGRRPAHLFGGLGILTGAIGMACLAYLTGVWFLTEEPIGTRPLLLFGVLLVLLSVQLLSVGLLAELIIQRDADRADPGLEVAELTTARDAIARRSSG